MRRTKASSLFYIVRKEDELQANPEWSAVLRRLATFRCKIRLRLAAGTGRCDKIGDCHKRRAGSHVESATTSAAADCPHHFFTPSSPQLRAFGRINHLRACPDAKLADCTQPPACPNLHQSSGWGTPRSPCRCEPSGDRFQREATLLHRLLDRLQIAGGRLCQMVVLSVGLFQNRQRPLRPLQRPRQVALGLQNLARSG